MFEYSFVKLIKLFSLKYITYYSVVYDDNETSLFEDFSEEAREKFSKEYNQILKMVQAIGDAEFLDPRDFLRHERNAYAFPFKANRLGVFSFNNTSLRLYCYVLDRYNIILFSGGMKTANSPKDCPNVKSKFEEAIRLSNCFDNNIEQFNKCRYEDDYGMTFLDVDSFEIDL